MLTNRIERAASSRVFLILILILCLGLRLGLAFYHADAEVRSDAGGYVEIARNIADGKGFSADVGDAAFPGAEVRPSAHGYVFYPFFLAGLMYAFDAHLLQISIAQSIIDTLSCLLVFLLALRVTSSRVAATGAALAYAVYPPFIISSCQAMTETTTTAILIGAIWLLVRAFRGGDWSFVLAGAMMGLAILAKPALLFFPVFITLVMFLRRRDVKEFAVRAAIYVVTAYLVVSPWTLRNSMVFHKFVPVTTNMGMVLWGSTGPYDGKCLAPGYPMDTKYRNISNDPLVPDVSEETFEKITKLNEQISGVDEIQRDQILKRAAIQEIREHPGRFALLAIKKPFRLWFNLWGDFPLSMGSYALAGLNALLLLFACIGLRGKPGVDFYYKLVTVSLCIYITLITTGTVAGLRYSYPIMPFVIILSAFALGRAIDRKISKGRLVIEVK